MEPGATPLGYKLGVRCRHSTAAIYSRLSSAGIFLLSRVSKPYTPYIVCGERGGCIPFFPHPYVVLGTCSAFRGVKDAMSSTQSILSEIAKDLAGVDVCTGVGITSAKGVWDHRAGRDANRDPGKDMEELHVEWTD